jgi:hypothetical protein
VQVLRKKADTVQAGQAGAYLRYMVLTLESACRAMQQGQEKWVWIMDMAGGWLRAGRGCCWGCWSSRPLEPSTAPPCPEPS